MNKTIILMAKELAKQGRSCPDSARLVGISLKEMRAIAKENGFRFPTNPRKNVVGIRTKIMGEQAADLYSRGIQQKIIAEMFNITPQYAGVLCRKYGTPRRRKKRKIPSFMPNDVHMSAGLI